MFCVFYSNSLTMAAAGAIRRRHSPNGGIQWLRVKPWMCFIRRYAPRHTTELPWQSKLLSIHLHFCCRRFIVALGTCTLRREVQPSNTLLSIMFTSSGITIFLNDVHWENAHFLIVVIEFGIYSLE
jgi:hypothetical protein